MPSQSGNPIDGTPQAYKKMTNHCAKCGNHSGKQSVEHVVSRNTNREMRIRYVSDRCRDWWDGLRRQDTRVSIMKYAAGIDRDLNRRLVEETGGDQSVQLSHHLWLLLTSTEITVCAHMPYATLGSIEVAALSLFRHLYGVKVFVVSDHLSPLKYCKL